MRAVHLDMKTGGEILPPTGAYVAGFISWKRMLAVLQATGEFTHMDKPELIQIDERGITYRWR